MKIQLIRNATMKITFGGKIILTDPMLSEKGQFQSFAFKEKNPTVNLNISKESIMQNVDFILSSHLHPDHFDQSATDFIKKELPVYCQPNDGKKLKNKGFKEVTEVHQTVRIDNLTITRTGGKHGKGLVLALAGKVSGFFLEEENEPSIYWVGDSILTEEVERTILKFKPDIIITHSGGAKLFSVSKLIMDAEDTVKIFKLSPNSKIIAIHMDVLDHCFSTRQTLRELMKKNNIKASRILIPEDNEIIEIHKT